MKLLIAFMVVLLSACSSNNRYKTYYGDYGNDAVMTINQKTKFVPELIDTFDIKGKVAQYEKQGYVVLGVSSFDGEWEARTKAIDFAKSIGATVIVTQSNLTGSIAQQYTISVPTSNTSYHSGSVYTSYGSSATYTGTTTTYGSQQFSRAYSLGQYEQEAVFLVFKEATNENN